MKDETAAKSLQQSAMDFIQSRLYGPGTKRTTSKITHCVIQTIFQTKVSRKTNISVFLSSDAEILSLKRKRGVNQGAAVEFASKKLGEE